VERDEDVGGLQIAVDDALRVRVLDSAADLQEQLQPFARRELVGIAELRDRHAAHSSITKYGRPVSVAPASKTFGDVLVVHQRQRLALGLEAPR
jgi:hypothetical protein